MELKVFTLVLVDGHPHEADEAGDPVVDVHHVVARGELCQERLAADAPARRAPALLGETEHLRVRDQRQIKAVLAQVPARRQRSLHQGEPGGARRLLRHSCGHPLLVEQLRQPLRLLRDDGDSAALT